MNKILTMLFTAAVVLSSQGMIYYASPDGTAEADCLSENTAGDIYTAVSKAKASGDIIQLAEGTYQITTSPVTLSVAGITLKGADEEDATKTVLLGPGTTKNMTGVVVTKKATISDLTIKNFYLTGKGGAAAAGANAAQTKADNLTAINCRVEANRSSSSGNNNRYNRAAAVYGGTWNNCFFLCNTNTVGNGGAADSGTFNSCVFTGNVAKYYGGAVYKGTSVKCRFENNTTYTDTTGGCGGAVYGGTSRECEFIGNKSFQGGAGGCAGEETAKFYDCVFRKNTALKISNNGGDGGALCGGGNAYLVVERCSFYNNEAKNDEGGAAKYGTFTDCYFLGNKTSTSGNGGALRNGIATRCIFDSNTAKNGGGTYNVSANECIYTNNVSASTGNGVDGAGSAVYGGTIKNSLIINNKEDSSLIKRAGTVNGATCINCTIVGNKTRGSYGAAHGGTFKNCIVIDNDVDIYGGTHYNTLYNTKGGSPTLTDCIQTTDAKFNAGAKADLPYYYLRASSPARDAGMDVGWTSASVDLRGKKRISGGKVDLGCYEYQTAGFMIRVK